MKRVLTFLLAMAMLFTMFPTSTLAGGVDAETEVVTEQIVNGTISFPEDAYIEGGSLIVDVWARGQITYEYKKVEYEIDSPEDIDFEFLFPSDENAVSIRVMIRNLSGAKTNIYTDTSSNLSFVLTENGTAIYNYDHHYIGIAELATKEFLIPCGKTISGKISGDNLQFVDNAYMTLSFGDYWTRAFVDAETHEYFAVMPYGITEGYYAPMLENSGESATSNILNGIYYYTESESLTINPAEDLTDLNFTVNTGYAVSGEVTIPENAVIDNYDITCELSFNDNIYYVTGITTKPGLSEDNRSIPFMLAVDKNSSVSTVLELITYGYMADDMLSSTSYSNVLVGTGYEANIKYYYSETETTLDKSQASIVTVDSDIEGINFDLQIGAVLSAEVTAPESVADQYIWYDFYAVSLDGNIISKNTVRINPENDVNYAQLVIPDTYEEVYLMYKVDYDVYGNSPDIYTGKAYINEDGTVTGFRSDADTYSTYGDVDVTFELAEFDDVDIPETLEHEGSALESSHPFLSSNTESIYYAYDGSGDASNLKVTFSPLSWINENATITICDAESNSTSYTAEEFNEYISGETIDITGPKFTVSITSVRTDQYMHDYGFAIVDVVAEEADEPDSYTYYFKVYDNSATSASMIPIEGATVSITDSESFSYMGTSDKNGGVLATLVEGKTYKIEVSMDGYVTYTEDFEATLKSAEEMNYLPLTKAQTQAFFVVLDKDTEKKVPNASISIIDADAATTSGGINLSTGADGNTPYAMLESGTYTVITSADGYVRNTQNFEISGKAQEVVIRLEKIEFDIADNTTFTVMDGETEDTPAISGASLTITDEDGNIISTKSTDSYGKVTANLENGTYHVTAIADGFETESYTVERTDSNNEFPIYLYRDGIVTVKTSVKEMTLDEMKDAGIDTDALGNKQVYNCTAVLSFIPDVAVNYIYSEDGEVIKGGSVTKGNKTVTPIAKDIYLLVKSQTSWLKETFEIQIICDNNSTVETIENLTADLTLPEGLSLAIMAEGEQKSEASLGNILPKGNASHKWYICGDKKGEYLLEGTLTGKRTGGIAKDMNLTFGIDKPITVLAGDAMTLTIDAETSATVGEPYIMRYTLENVSEKTIYNLSYSVLGGKFFDDYTVTAAKYAKEYGPDGTKDLKGEGFLFETKEFKPGEKISGVFEITFGEELFLGKGQEWILTDTFIVTGLGSTTVIPTTVNWLSDVPAHNWNEGEVTKAATCTEDGVITYKCNDAECDESYTDVIKATGHSMGEYTKVEPTCTEEGTETSKCQNPNCTHSVVLTSSALGHDWEADYRVDVAPTCEVSGSKSIHCARANCNETKDVTEISAPGHDMNGWTETVAPTCTSDGEKRNDCKNCNYYETDIIPLKGHSWDSGVVTTPPTEEKEGEKTFNCTSCGETKTEPVPVLVKQQLEFARIGDITITYGQFKYVDNMAYNDSENGSVLIYASSNPDVATVDENGRATITGAGETIITATAAATDIYAETAVSYKLTVNKASLTIAPVNTEIFYAETPDFKEYSATGFVYDEDKTVLTGEAVYKTDYEQYNKVGTYKIEVSGLSAENYNINFVDGTLTVKKAENYVIEISNLSQRKGSTEAVVTSISPKDDSAVIKVEYKTADNTWSEEVPDEIGDYDVRASLVSADNIAPKENYYNEAVLSVKAGAMIDINGGTDLSIETQVDGDKVEFNITDEDVETIIDNIPANGEVVIDAKGSTDGVKELTLPSNIINALDENEKAKSLTVLADDAEITMDTKVLETVANKVSATDKVSIHIDAVEKEELNEKQQEALNTLGDDNAVILQLNLVVTNYENGEPVNEQVHQLNGKVDVRAAYTLPDDMQGKRVLVCYVADDGSVSYVRAKYDNGFVSFTTNHFSHYALVTIPCPHDWGNGTVITPATTSSTGIIRYTCSLCDVTKDETIPVITVSYGGRGSSSTSTITYTVTYQTNGGSEINKSSVNMNAVIAEPAAPVKEGYVFDGWYTDKELTKAYDFSSKVTKSFTLYAKWNELEKAPEEEENKETSMEYTDVKATDWFFDSVKYVVDNKLMNGISETEFAPDNTLTRAMLVTVLYRNAGSPATNRSIPFADVDMGAYYANAVSWAKQNGIVNGITENEFAPDSNITREQIATIMYRYAQYKGMDAVSLEENLHFTDTSEISEYAVSAMNWAVGKGLMKGKSTTTINPKDIATRAEIAAILQRFIETNK